MQLQTNSGYGGRPGWLAPFATLLIAVLVNTTFALPTISEFSATGGLEDENGIDSDWIEIYNPDNVPVSLNGYYLTDDTDDLTKWMFPEVTLGAGSYLVVFASGNNLIESPDKLHTSFRLSLTGEYLGLIAPDGTTPVKQFQPVYPEQRSEISYGTGSIGSSTRETVIQPGADAKWHVPAGEIPDWNTPGFDDAAWTSGKTGIGYGYDELTGEGGHVEAAMKGNNATVYIRLPFEIPEPDAVIGMTMKLKYEDGFVAYLNGSPIADDQAPPAPDPDAELPPENPLAFDSKATKSRSDSLAEEYVTIEVRFAGKLVKGTNILAFQSMNSSAGGSDLILLPEVTAEFRDLNAPIADGYFIEPTPGATNSVGSGDPPESVAFSIPTQTFTDKVTVELTAPGPDAVIRYTTDGSIPVDTLDGPSPEYTEPLEFNDTVQLRARAFVSGKLAGPVHSEAYVKLAADFAEFTSQLPILILENFGAGSPSRDRMFFALIFEPKGPDNVADVRNMPDLVTRSRAKQRGSSTGGWPKFGLVWEAWDEFDNDKVISPLGLPANADWVLNTRYEFDRALMRNPFMYRLSNQAGQWAPRTKFIEVFVNTDGEEVDNESRRSDYFGVYCLMEKISRGPHRVNVSSLDQSDNEEPRVTGGYMWKVDRLDPSDRGIRGIRDASNSIGWVYPKEQVNRQRVVTDEQEDYFVGYFNEFVAAAKADDFINPDTGKHYSEYIDIPSWLNEHIFRGLSKDPDAFRLSTYLYKPRGGKIHYGPLWDFDRTMGCDTDGRALNPERWDGGSAWWTYSWWRELVWEPGRRRSNKGDPDFMQAYVDRYQSLRMNEMSVANMNAIVDGMAAEIGTDAANRNFDRWREKSPNGGRFAGDAGRGWEGEVAHLKGWLQARVEWWDTLFADRPKMSTPGGIVPEGFQLTMTAEAGPVYYTLDGSDPRAPGGGISETAIQFPGGRVDGTLIEEKSPVRYLVPLDGSLGDTWLANDFSEAAWAAGTTGLGFETAGGTLEEKISTNISDLTRGVNASVYLRSEFTISNEVANVNELTLKMQYDDGFVAYINGAEVARANAPDPVAWNSEAESSHSDKDAIVFEDFEVLNFKDYLVKGENVLAIQVMNTSVGGSDMLIQHGLDINETIVAEPLFLNNSAVVTSRTFTEELWSSPVIETYIVGGTVPASAENIVVSEIMYLPPLPNVEEDARGYNSRVFEFLEVRNISSNVVDLTNVKFTDGVTFDFTGSNITFLLPGEHAVVVQNSAAFKLRYGASAMARVAGEFTENTALRLAGERLILTAAGGGRIKEFRYGVESPWPTGAPTERFSIVLVDPASNPNHDNAANWAKSAVPQGTPGTGDAIDPNDPGADNDGDGLSAFLEFALGSTDDNASSGQGLIGVGASGNGPAFTYQKNQAATDVTYALETSIDLITWNDADDLFELVSETDNGDGTSKVSVKWKGDAAPEDGDVYIRLRATGSQ